MFSHRIKEENRKEEMLPEASSKQGRGGGDLRDRAGTAKKKKPTQNVLSLKCLIPLSYSSTGGRELFLQWLRLGHWDQTGSNSTQTLTSPVSLNKTVTSLSFSFRTGETGTIMIILRTQKAGVCTKCNVCKD